MTRLNGKTPVITGGAAAKRGMDAPTAVLIGVTGGLGHALARLLAAEGFRMVLAARREYNAAALTGRSDGSAIYLRADVTNPASLEKLAAAAFEHLGQIDAVVNLAGISPRKSIEDYTPADVDALLAVNVKGPIFVTQAFLPGLRKQAGTVTSPVAWAAAATEAGSVMSSAIGLAPGRSTWSGLRAAA